MKCSASDITPPRETSASHRRSPWIAVVASIAIGVSLVVGSGELAAQRAGRPLSDASGLWISESAVDPSRRLLVVVDPASRHAAVYHLDAATGSLALKSTRDLTWDLMVDDFNAQEPRPAAIRRLMQAGPTGPAEADPR
ncbi:MAG: hypothetical protein ACKO4T_05730 [Planctomycetaceae bacterium]